MPATKGDLVKVEYSGKLEDGTVFDSSDERGPLEFRLGQGEIIPGFEEAVMGLEVGEKRDVIIPPDRGYGQRDEALVIEVPGDTSQAGVEEGCVVALADQSGQPIGEGIVTSVGDGEVTIDMNHPLAGHTLNFEIKLDEIEERAQ